MRQRPLNEQIRELRTKTLSAPMDSGLCNVLLDLIGIVAALDREIIDHERQQAEDAHRALYRGGV